MSNIATFDGQQSLIAQSIDWDRVDDYTKSNYCMGFAWASEVVRRIPDCVDTSMQVLAKELNHAIACGVAL